MIDLVDLRGRVVSVALPASLAAGFQVVEQDAGLAVDGQSWRVEVTRSNDPSRAVTEGWVPAPSAVVGTVGVWTVTLSGDRMTPQAVGRAGGRRRTQVASGRLRPVRDPEVT